MKRTNSILLTLFSLLLCSCVHEFAVIDNSFEFEAAVTYDDAADVHRLTLTRKSGSEDNQYIISFTVDGESTLSPSCLFFVLHLFLVSPLHMHFVEDLGSEAKLRYDVLLCFGR